MRAPRAALAVALAVGAGLFASPPQVTAVDEAWTAATAIDPESVEEIPAATVRNTAGFTLAIAREPGSDRVIGILRLPPSDQDFLDEGRPLGIQIDGGPRLEPRRVGGGLKSSSFVLWDGAGEPVVGPLRDLMEAKERIVVQYPLAGGGHKEIELAATGARATIASVLGVAEEAPAPARELAIARQEAVERCLAEAKTKDRERCLERLKGCAGAAAAEDLRACVAAAKK